VDSKHPSGERIRPVLAASLALAVFWCGNALARTQPEPDCADVAKRLKSLDVPAESLTAKPVDHVPIILNTTDIVDEVNADDMPTPLISLSPRAESALQDVFEVADEVVTEEVSAEVPSSPVAESEDLPDLSELPKDGTAAEAGDSDIDLPMLQRRMFRTDI
jgi:hypothetical protein